MTDYFAELQHGDELVVNLQRFYQTVGHPDTLAHVTKVAAEARTLAKRHGADMEAANLAALAHDLAAIVPVAEMPGVAQCLGVTIGEVDRVIPLLLHGPIAAAVLASLGMEDRDLLNAVHYHSTLRAGASTLEKIVFLADKITYDPESPHGGEYVPALLAAPSLDEAALVYLDFLLDNVWRYGWLLHPHAVAAYRELVGRG